MGIAFDTVENALRAWVLGATGLADDHVIWWGQTGPRPSTPYAELKLATVDPTAMDWFDSAINPSSNGHDGAELLYTARGQRNATLEVQVFAATTPGVTPSMSTKAVAIAQSIVDAAALPGVRAALNAATIGVLAFNPVQLVGGAIESAVFEPRAHFVAHLNIPSETTDTDTVIDTVELTDQTASPPIVFDVSDSP